VLHALSRELSGLESITGDWASWDDTYTFIEDANTEYVQSNLIDGTFIELKLNLMMFIYSSGRNVFTKAFDLQNEEEIAIPSGLQEHLSSDSPLVAHPDTESSTTGIVLLSEGPMLVSFQPVLTSEDAGPIRGTLIMARYLDNA
jgi:sensor domain CHASE-containing protein